MRRLVIAYYLADDEVAVFEVRQHLGTVLGKSYAATRFQKRWQLPLVSSYPPLIFGHAGLPH